VPPTIAFATTPALARMRACAAKIPAVWVTGDSGSGSDSTLRFWLRGKHRPYVLALTGAHHLWDGGIQRRVEGVVADLPADAWQRLTVGTGRKGPRVVDWAVARLPSDTEPGVGQWLLVRRAVAEPDALA
jgi:hypothetical protein